MTRKKEEETEQLFLFLLIVPRQERKSRFPACVKFMQRRNICFTFSKNVRCHASREGIGRKRRRPAGFEESSVEYRGILGMTRGFAGKY